MKNAQVLIVDDDDFNLIALRRLISLAGYECETANSRQSAIEMLSRQPYKLAIIDLRLSGGLDEDEWKEGGMEIVNWLSNTHSQTKAIIFSAYLTVSATRDLLRSGIVLDVLSKSESPQVLVARIHEVMKPR